jgi:hypothetical protein
MGQSLAHFPACASPARNRGVRITRADDRTGTYRFIGPPRTLGN